MMYRCMICSKEVPVEDVQKRIRCPYCGYRILVKGRPATTPVRARSD